MKYQQIENARYIVDAYQIRGTYLESYADCPTWVRNAIENRQLFLEADGTFTITNTNCYGIEVGSFLIRVIDGYIVSMPEECFLSHYRLQPETTIVNSGYAVEDLLYNATDVCVLQVQGLSSVSMAGMEGYFLCVNITNPNIVNTIFATEIVDTPTDNWFRLQFQPDGICVYPMNTFESGEYILQEITTELGYQFIMSQKAYYNALTDINHYITEIGGSNDE